MTWLRVRFTTDSSDYRPVVWPIVGPYWCTGYDSNDFPVLVAYVKSIEQLKEYWPEAQNIDTEEVDSINYNSRFPKPSWYEGEQV